MCNVPPSLYSDAFIVIVLPLGSSKRSIVLISIIIVIPAVRMNNKINVINIPDQIGTDVKPTQSYESPKYVWFPLPIASNHGWTWSEKFPINNYQKTIPFHILTWKSLIFNTSFVFVDLNVWFVQWKENRCGAAISLATASFPFTDTFVNTQ